MTTLSTIISGNERTNQKQRFQPPLHYIRSIKNGAKLIFLRGEKYQKQIISKSVGTVHFQSSSRISFLQTCRPLSCNSTAKFISKNFRQITNEIFILNFTKNVNAM